MHFFCEVLLLHYINKPILFSDDFKPASVDTKKKGNVVVGDRNMVEVKIPHVDSSGTAETVFKGNKSAAAKECLLIIDHETGNITLERFSQKLSVKKYR